MNDVEFNRTLAAELYAHLGTATKVRFRKRETATFKPQPHDCHENVDRWCSLHPQSMAVRGWLVFTYPLASYPVVRFQAHSVIEEGGRLVDITPREGSKDMLFLPHPDGNEMFVLTLSKREIGSVTHRRVIEG